MQMDVFFCGVVFWILFFCICRLHHKVPEWPWYQLCITVIYQPVTRSETYQLLTFYTTDCKQDQPLWTTSIWYSTGTHVCKWTLQHCFLAWTWTQCSAVHSSINVDTQHMVHMNFLYSQTTAIQPSYTGCPRRNVPDFGRVFLMLKYTNITQKTYVQSWMVKEIMAREKCGLLAGPRTVPVSWQSYPCPSLSVVSYDSSSAHARLIPECVVSLVKSPLGSHLSCIVLGTLRTTMTRVRVFL